MHLMLFTRPELYGLIVTFKGSTAEVLHLSCLQIGLTDYPVNGLIGAQSIDDRSSFA